MPDYAKIFTYEVDGLTYTVSVYEEGGQFFADITVLEGAMDVNALYFGDDDFSGTSERLSGPLGMNGASLDGEAVQWDGAIKLSDPGLGPDGTEKETFLMAGDTLKVELDIASLDDIDVVGVRATSTTTDDGSIKGVSDDPEEPPIEDPLYSKVFFGEVFSESGDPLGGTFILDEEPDPNEYNVPALPEGTEPTFDNYVSHYVNELGGDVTQVQSVVFYDTDDEGNLMELFRLDAPEGGFTDTDDLLMAYDDLLDAEPAASDPALDLMAALSLAPTDAETDLEATDDMTDDEIELL